MKINSTHTTPVNTDRAATATTGKSVARGAGRSADATKVAVSDAASQLAASATSSDFNASKVQSVSSAIANGTYKVNAGSIADKMLSDVGGLSRRA
ncbi:MAG TPA: flagellar biosynthesis anti-sigma factor FlgM [Burkholderiaceae bacterium]|nr:flagellar biosynthesis anti-sigma factor FlgM [Burkholderiaceae bacterium]